MSPLHAAALIKQMCLHQTPQEHTTVQHITTLTNVADIGTCCLTVAN